MEFTIYQIATLLNGEIVGDGNEKINMLAKIQDAQKGQITFLANPKYEQFVYRTQASAIIVKKDFERKKEIKSTLILVDDPYNCFTILLEEYYKQLNLQLNGVEEPSYLGKGCSIEQGIYRGAFSYIGNECIIGENVKIHPHVCIGNRVTIGANTVLYSGVKIYAGVRLGAHCTIHAGTVIGSDGFGFAPQSDGTYKSIPQLGNVLIEDYVSIGSNTVIDCATLLGDSTIIRKGVKLDNLIHVAHNVEIGENTVIAAQTGISGSTKIGKSNIIAGQVGIAGHLVTANKTGIGAQAGILKSIKEEGQNMMGSPAFNLKDYFRSYSAFKNLPKLIDEVNQLSKKIS